MDEIAIEQERNYHCTFYVCLYTQPVGVISMYHISSLLAQFGLGTTGEVVQGSVVDADH